MSYSAVPTVATGDTWSAANHNTYIRDNFAAGVPDIFTAAGDIAYATAANAASPLAIGSSDQVLTVKDGLPAWGDGPGITLLAESTLVSTFSSSDILSLAGIPGDYTHLCVEMCLLVGDTDTAIAVNFNEDYGNNYSRKALDYIDTSSPYVFPYTPSSGNNEIFYGKGHAYKNAHVPSVYLVEIFNYSNASMYKCAHTRGFTVSEANLFRSQDIQSVWKNDAAITSIQFRISPLFSVGTFLAGSTFRIYGKK